MRKFFIILTLISLSLSCHFLPSLAPDTGSSTRTDACLKKDPTAKPIITLEGLYEEYFGVSESPNGIAGYLNAGAAASDLENRLVGIQTDSNEKVKAQVIVDDVTGDSIVDVIVSLALPTAPGYGDAILAIYTCQDGQYLRHSIFGRTGAGSRSEGLFDGGGAHLVTVEDLNSDGISEIVFFVASLGELYIAGWDGEDFISLVQYSDELGNMQTYIPAQEGEGSIELKDMNNDGNLDVVVTNPASSEIWIWEETHFQLVEE